MDGIPALDLWDLVLEVFHCDQNQPVQNQGSISTGKFVASRHDKHTEEESNEKLQPCTIVLSCFILIMCLRLLDFLSQLLCCTCLRTNEAVIKMIIKGRSPTMRHVSRTHRVSLDWLFDRINLDPKIQIRYIDTKHQIADILTKGHFIRDEWNNLLCLFNISHFSFLCCAKKSA